MSRYWSTFFSQTGSEIVEISNSLNRWPDLIITNERPEHLRKIHPALEGKVTFVKNKPTDEELLMILGRYENPIITLHGWLRIMPPTICNRFEIYNGHPGLISPKWFPQLKNKDPQIRAWEGIIRGEMKVAGCVIHRVTEGVDEGEILEETYFDVKGINSLDEFYKTLSNCSLQQWVAFLKKIM